MGERLIKPYEISVWEDKLIPIDGSDPVEYKIVENKLAVIGSDTMTGLNKVYNPVFNKKTNGEKTLTFSLKYKYFDPYSGNDDIINPFASLLINERKIKLHYDKEWYEFVIKDHTESSDGYEWTYTCSDAFVLELSKIGYNITFDSELSNNQGTALELAKETIKNTDWRVGDINSGKQLIAEPVYKATLVSTTDIDIINVDKNNYEDIPTAGQSIYVFYSYIKNQSGKFVQFIIRDDNKKYTIDDKNVITDTNFRVKTELFFRNNRFETEDGFPIITLGEIETRYQVNRLAYNQRTTYDPVMERTVDRFRAGDREIYKYTDSIYSTSDVLVNYITNGDNFNMLEDGSLQGWNPYVGGGGETIKKLELITKPEILSQQLINLESLFEIEGFLKVQFNGALTQDYRNAIYNSGFENNASSIESVAKGQKFVLRWRAKQGTLDSMTPATGLRAIVAKYSQDTPTPYNFYYKHIDPNNIILQFTGTPVMLNNIVEGGYIDWNNNNYYIDEVAQTISTKYIYKDSNNNQQYVWSGAQKKFVVLDTQNYSNYLPYYYLTAEATKTVPNSVLSDSSQKYGIFIYNTVGEITYFIQDIQLTRFISDGVDITGNTPILIGNVPVATSKLNEYYYLKPSNNITKEDIKTYASLDAIKNELQIVEDIVPIYNENSEKVLSISAAQSNCFNILQTIAETFECWIELDVKHDPDTGYILYDEDGLLQKYINIREYVGKDNYAGFKYGINLQSIERDINSDEIVTKLIVDQTQSDYTDEGFVSITNASSNISGESYILNFNYYYSQGLLNKDEVEKDRLSFIEKISELNADIKAEEEKRRNLTNSLNKLSSDRNVYTELVTTAEDNQSLGLEDFKSLTGLKYGDYQGKQSQTTQYEGNYYILTSDETVLNGKDYYIRDGNTFKIDDRLEEGSNPKSLGDYEIFLDVTQEETLLDILGELYVNSSTINNYSGIRTNIELEYQNVKKELYGLDNYNIKIWTDRDALGDRHVYVELNDYLPGFYFVIDGSPYHSTVSVKFFDKKTDATNVTFYAPQGYKLIVNEQQVYSFIYNINDNVTSRFKIKSVNTVEGVVDKIDTLIEQKTLLVKEFENKYSNFIQEGSWSSTDYIDSELYYLDAIQVSNTSSQPVISYTINVVEVSQIEGLELYTFDTGDKTYVEDTEFFGWNSTNIGTKNEPDYVLTPAREEVIVSEVEWHLDEPEQNTITVQNYKTRFEDLFQRINATVQTVQYNKATYAKISTLLDANGTLNQNVLLDSLNNLSGKQYNLTSNGSVVIQDDIILIQNLNNAANRVIINSEGIRISSDGGEHYTTAIDGQGINLGTVYTGTLNTNEVIIGDKEKPSFRWDKAGISAFKFYENSEDEAYDLQTFVRFDQYGLYGIKNNGSFKAQDLNDVKDKAHFAVTWDGFFIKNSYEGGGKVEITSDNDFRVLKSGGLEKIKIGALEWDDANGDTTIDPALGVGAPTLYGIRIKNDSGETVMKTGDDGNLEITGTIYANAGEIGGMVVNNNKLTMDTIVLEPGVGIYSTEKINNQPAFIISDINGGATFRNINALGGTLGQLTVQDTITVGDATHSGTIQSYGYTTGVSGWAIKSNGTAEFQNAVVRGEINATSGVFSGNVQVGTSNPYISIDGQQALICSSNYRDGAGTGWLINKDGDAYFNNITARGAIRTAVFEYAEIQAVGGVFIFRPSSTIRSAAINGNNLVLTVEKPQLFKDGQWCKVSNYTADGEAENPDITSILLNNGLTHVYQVSRTQGSNNITLLGAAAMVGNNGVVDNVTDLVGGALVDMGNKAGTSNYGIGINSSDNTVNLPARAISLFETAIDETQEPKVTYNYRGILGTLPTMSTGVDTSIYQYMQGTQGIYTDNMYIGDEGQFVAFYEDGNGNKQLKIKANQIVYEVTDEHGQGTGVYHDVNQIEAEGVPGTDGKDAIQVIIESSAGNMFFNKDISSTLTCTVLKGGVEDITNQVTKFTWKKKDKDGNIDSSWSRLAAGRTITIGPADITSKAIFVCEVEF